MSTARIALRHGIDRTAPTPSAAEFDDAWTDLAVDEVVYAAQDHRGGPSTITAPVVRTRTVAHLRLPATGRRAVAPPSDEVLEARTVLVPTARPDRFSSLVSGQEANLDRATTRSRPIAPMEDE